MSKREIVLKLILIAIIAVGIILALIVDSRAEEELDTVWVLCQPDSYVTIRSGPGKHYSAESFAYAGDSFQKDGLKKGQYIHLAKVPNELGEGWISTKYVSYSEPETYENGKAFKVNVKQVNTRMCIGGNRRGTLKKGAEVKVFLMADDWSVTNKGYIQSKFLE